jgi:hypothetical protein
VIAQIFSNLRPLAFTSAARLCGEVDADADDALAS